MITLDLKKIKLAILSVSSLLMISITASAILADVQAHFVGADQSLVQMVLTLPALLALFFAFASGPLSTHIPKKSLVVFGLISGLTGGMVALFFGSTSLVVLLSGSVLVGVAQGINATMTMSLITDYFSVKESGAIMGLQSAVVNGGSVVLLFTSGLLGGIQWNYSYLVYLAFIPVLVIFIKNLPKDIPPAHRDDQHCEKSGKLNGTVYFIALVMLLFGTFLFVFQTNIALLVVSKGYGDSSISGLINTAMSIGGMVTGLIFGRMQYQLKQLTIPVASFVASFGMFLIFLVGTLPVLFIAAMCIGFGISTIIPAGSFIVANAVSPGMRATAIAIVTAAISLGMFVSPIILNAITDAFGGGSITFKFMLSAFGLLGLALLVMVGNHVIVKK